MRTAARATASVASRGFKNTRKPWRTRRAVAHTPRQISSASSGRAIPERLTTSGESISASNAASGMIANTKSGIPWPCRPLTLVSVTAPRTTTARRFRSICEASVPSTIGSVSRVLPRRRATISAREGSPRRAGSVADMSTPMNVPCKASATVARRAVGAARRIACQARPRASIDTHISPSPAISSEGCDAARLATTRPTPTSAMPCAPRPRTASELTASASRRRKRPVGAWRRATRARSGDAVSVPPERVESGGGSCRRGSRGFRSAHAKPQRTATRPVRVGATPIAAARS